ncbi:flagellar motor protein MotB [Algihabitans albus]|uniref:flagellar motor protein MotB n=1 Tax=Algihabitans albus TaxID=2164067 RepID=UPI000E5D266A|nr:flagellar motor protein MotB [Algihabitans albus]
MAGGENHAPIIIKKVKKGGGHGHHGGAWKVAYADFVTAMMAFFLLLWLLASTSEEQRQGIADYFSPTVVTDSTTSGAGGVLGGQTVTTEGAARDTQAPMGVVMGMSDETSEDDDGENDGAATEDSTQAGSETDFDGMTPDQAAAAEAKAEQEREEFDKIAQQLRNAIASVPELSELSENLLVDQTPEGLRIQIVDRQNKSMFASGSALPLAHTRTLLNLVADAVKSLPNEVAIKGHTDAAPFRGDGNYSNWELSSDRAHASRRALLASGLPTQRVAYVVGKADREPLNDGDPFDAVNRRISIVLLRDGLTEAQVEGGAPAPIQPAFEPPRLFERSEKPAEPAATQAATETSAQTSGTAAGSAETPTGNGVEAQAATTARPAAVREDQQFEATAPPDPFTNVLTFGN